MFNGGGFKVSGLRSKARALAPEAFDPGQPVEFAGLRGIIWSLAPVPGRGMDAVWVAVEDGSVRKLQLVKEPKAAGGGVRAHSWGGGPFGSAYWPANPVPFKVAEFLGEAAPDGQLILLAA